MTKKQFDFLKFISSSSTVSDVNDRFGDTQHDPEINDDDFQKYFLRHEDVVYITVEGKDAVEQRITENFRWRIPIVISLVALTISVVSIVLQYL